MRSQQLMLKAGYGYTQAFPGAARMLLQETGMVTLVQETSSPHGGWRVFNILSNSLLECFEASEPR